MTVPDGAEYWWDVRGWTRMMEREPRRKGGHRKCPLCGITVMCIKHGKRHWKKEHGYQPLPNDFPLEPTP